MVYAPPHLDDAAAQLLAVVQRLQQADLLAGCLVRQLVRLRLEGADLQTRQLVLAALKWEQGNDRCIAWMTSQQRACGQPNVID